MNRWEQDGGEWGGRVGSVFWAFPCFQSHILIRLSGMLKRTACKKKDRMLSYKTCRMKTDICIRWKVFGRDHVCDVCVWEKQAHRDEYLWDAVHVSPATAGRWRKKEEGSNERETAKAEQASSQAPSSGEPRGEEAGGGGGGGGGGGQLQWYVLACASPKLIRATWCSEESLSSFKTRSHQWTLQQQHSWLTIHN